MLERHFQIPGWTELKDRLNMYMEQYNETVRGARMDLVFFKDAMINLIKVQKLFTATRPPFIILFLQLQIFH